MRRQKLNRARFYQPNIGRFSQEDPLASAGDPRTLYVYVHNGPVRAVDPMGAFDLSRDLDSVTPALIGVANFGSGFYDSMTFGITASLREPNSFIDTCGALYRAGEYSEIAAELATGGLSVGLKRAAAGASRAAVRAAGRQGVTAARKAEGLLRGGEVHHLNGLFSGLFPTGGLPAAVHSGSWNLRLVLGEFAGILPGAQQSAARLAHMQLHLRLLASERFAMVFFHPATTAARAARNEISGCGCR